MMAPNVASIICQVSSECGTEYVFGLPGTQNLPLLEALRNSKLQFVSANHELSAVFMAIGYYRATAKPALVTTIPGPGFTYALTGIAEASEDSCALIYLLVVPSNPLGKAYFLHDLRHEKIIRPLVKKIFKIKEPKETARVISEAHAVSLDGEPGPVFVTVSADLIEKNAARIDSYGRRKTDGNDQTALKGAARHCAEKLLGSSRPVLFLGMGAGKSSLPLQEFSVKHRIPVFSTVSGRGVIPADHRMHLPVDFSFGMPKPFKRLMEQVDCLLALGCKLSHNGTGGYSTVFSEKKLINVNSSTDNLNANYRAHLAIHARVEEMLPLLEAEIKDYKTGWSDAELQNVRCKLEKQVQSRSRVFPRINGKPIQQFFAALRRAMPRKSVLVTDSGLHQVMTRQFFPVFCPGGLIVPSDFQSMGFALPAAIGVTLSDKKQNVICLVGDGGFNISALEIMTALREKLNLLIIVFRDGYFGQIRLSQIYKYGAEFGTEFCTPRYTEMAAALNIKYVELQDPIDECIRRCIQMEGPKLMELSLQDSPVLSKMGLVASAKAKIRPLLGPAIIRMLKKTAP